MFQLGTVLYIICYKTNPILCHDNGQPMVMHEFVPAKPYMFQHLFILVPFIQFFVFLYAAATIWETTTVNAENEIEDISGHVRVLRTSFRAPNQSWLKLSINVRRQS